MPIQIKIGIGIGRSYGGTGGGTPVDPNAFRFTLRNGASGFTLPLVNGVTYNFLVNWGDGSPVGTVTAYNDADASHTFATNGNYQVSITGDMPVWDFTLQTASAAKMVVVNAWGILMFTDLTSMFEGCSNMTSVASASALTFDGTSDYTRMFYGCGSLVSIGSLILTDGYDPFDDIFTGCSSLASCGLSGIEEDISFAGCNLDAAALDVIFGNLNVAGKTITITGNPGVNTCTRSIATNKGWTVLPAVTPSGSTYLRPGGTFTYLRPGGVDQYLRP